MLTKGAKLNTYTPLIQDTLGKLSPPTFNSLVSHACAKPIAKAILESEVHGVLLLLAAFLP
jgi:hypothetical protein